MPSVESDSLNLLGQITWLNLSLFWLHAQTKAFCELSNFSYLTSNKIKDQSEVSTGMPWMASLVCLSCASPTAL